MQTVRLNDYVVQSITLYDGTYKDGYKEQYSTNEHEQTQAFESLMSICKEEKVVSSIWDSEEMEDDKLSGLAGPKRIEVTLRYHQSKVEKRLVVLDVVPPKGHFNSYSISGRTWDIYKKLERLTTTQWAGAVWLTRIDVYLGGEEGSATDHFTPQTQARAWAVLEKMFLKFQRSELTVLKNWEADGEGDLIAQCGYAGRFYGPNEHSQHWTNKTPAAYEPKKAYYRVSGDEVGAMIHREQQKNWEEEGKPDPEASLKKMLEAKTEKKSEAGGTPDSGTNSQTFNGRCNDCGSYECSPAFCNEDIDLAAFGGVVLNGGSSIH